MRFLVCKNIVIPAVGEYKLGMGNVAFTAVNKVQFLCRRPSRHLAS